MARGGPDDKIHPAGKLAAIVTALTEDGVAIEDALRAVQLTAGALASPRTRVSINQILWICREAMERAHDPFFAYHAGLRMRVSTFGLFGFAILTSTNFRQTVRVAAKYHELTTPLAGISFREEAGCGIWTVDPEPHPLIDARLYRFLVEMQFGIHVSLHRDVMGPAFKPTAFRFSYAAPLAAQPYRDAFSCDALFAQPSNELAFDATLLDAVPPLGDRLTNPTVLKMCDELLEEFDLRKGLSGRVREALLANLAEPTPVDDIARHLGQSPRTLRRKLQEEGATIQKLRDELRLQVAIKYLRDTDVTVEEASDALGFNEAANFRRAFARWTKMSPQQFRAIAGNA
jgi:AraC-like DNA-binding protein